MLFALSQWAVFSLAGLVAFHAWQQKNLILFLFLLADAWCLEYVTLHLFSAVTYQPLLLSVAGIPLLVIAGWGILTYSMIISTAAPRVIKSLVVALALVLIDLVLDPAAVRAGFWQWHQTTGYFGIPYENFFAWAAYAFLVSFFLHPHLQKLHQADLIRAFIAITGIGLVAGMIWRAIPLSTQPVAWWGLFLVGAMWIIRNHHHLAIHRQYRYLLGTGICFFVFSYGLSFFFRQRFPIEYWAFSSLFFFSWLGFFLLPLRAHNDIHILEHNYPSYPSERERY